MRIYEVMNVEQKQIFNYKNIFCGVLCCAIVFLLIYNPYAGAIKDTTAKLESSIETTRLLGRRIAELEKQNSELASTKDRLAATNRKLEQTNRDLNTTQEQLRNTNRKLESEIAALRSTITGITDTVAGIDENLSESTDIIDKLQIISAGIRDIITKLPE